MTLDLSRLLRPRHVAVFGGGWAENVVEQCRRMGFDGAVWPVNPKRDTLAGLPCYRSVADLPEAPDASFVGVNRHASIDVVTALAARGAGGAICFASGFAEAEDDRRTGAELQARLFAAAGAMPVLGPNCYGLINYLDGALLWPDQHGGRRVERGVAIIGQSSNMLISMTMQRRGLPLAYCLAAGNQAQTGLAEMALALIEDPRVTAIGLHIEGIRDVRGFEALARVARAARKPVVALKVGRSAAAQAATISHTASIAGGDAAGRAFLKRLGIAVVDTLPEFLETLKFLHVHGPIAGREICSVSCSGGEASLIGDMAEGRRLSFRPFSADQRKAIAAVLGPLVTVSNPLDYHTFIWGDRARMEAAFTAVTTAGFDLTIFILDFPRDDRCDPTSWEPAVLAIAAAARAGGRPVAIAATLPENMPEGRTEALIEEGVAPMASLAEALTAAEAAAGIAEAWSAPERPPVLCPTRGDAAPEVLSEHRAKQALRAHGVMVPEAREATTPTAAADTAGALGFPVALKGQGFAHKTEAGAVRLNLRSAEEVRAAAEAMAGARGFLVERMATGGVAELILGVTRDPVYGYQITLGAGGVLAEMLSDSATLPIPASEAEVAAALDGLRIAPLLAGHRGRAPADRGAILAAVHAVQAFAEAESHRLAELDINPLIVTADGAVAADALVRFAPLQGEDASHAAFAAQEVG